LENFKEPAYQIYSDISVQGLKQLQNKDKGILLIDIRNYRSVDTKFKKDGFVLIGCDIESIG
jgi:hypothetical protein